MPMIATLVMPSPPAPRSSCEDSPAGTSQRYEPCRYPLPPDVVGGQLPLVAVVRTGLVAHLGRLLRRHPAEHLGGEVRVRHDQTGAHSGLRGERAALGDLGPVRPGALGEPAQFVLVDAARVGGGQARPAVEVRTPRLVEAV